MLTNNSGVEVPKATTVRPIAIEEILNFLATEEAPFTRKSAPFIRITNPISNRVTVNNIALGLGIPKDRFFHLSN
jgi:hypothetical protein